jgi:hypothetical protein
MAASDPAPPAPSPPPVKPVAWKRWLRRVSLAALGLAILLPVLLHTAWRQRVSLIQAAASRALPGMDVRLDAVDLHGAGLQLRGLRLSKRGSDLTPVKIGSARLSQNWLSTRHLDFGDVEIEDLHVNGSLEDLLAMLPSTPAAGKRPASKPASWSLRSLSLKRARVDLQTAEGASVQFQLDHQAGGISAGAGIIPDIDQASFQFTSLAAALAGAGTLEVPKLDLELAAKNGRMRVRRATLGTVVARVDTDALAILQNLVASDKTRADETSRQPPVLAALQVDEIEVADLDFIAANGLRLIPGADAVALAFRLRWNAKSLAWEHGSPPHPPVAQDALVRDLTLQPLAPDGDGRVRDGKITIPQARLTLGQPSAASTFEISRLRVPGGAVFWTPDLEAALLPALETAAAESSQPASPAVLLRSVEIPDLSLQFLRTPRLPATGRAVMSLNLKEIALGGPMPSSAETQELGLRDVNLALPIAGLEQPAEITCEEIRLALTPDTLAERSRVDHLSLTSPVIQLLMPPPGAAAEPETRPPTSATGAKTSPLPDSLHINEFAVTGGALSVTGHETAPFQLECAWDARTLEAEDSPDDSATPESRHQLTVSNARLLTPDRPQLPVARLDQVSITASLPGLIRGRKVDSIAIGPGRVEAGQSLFALLEQLRGETRPTSGPAAAPPPEAAHDDSPGWTAGSVEVSDVGISMPQIAPGLPPVSFILQTRAGNAPLGSGGLLANLEPQKVELSQLTIPAPYGSVRPVARLNNIFLHFTLDGLLRRQVEKIEILNPTIYVGEPLFWYVEFYRQLKSQTDTQPDEDAENADAVPRPSNTPPPWQVRTLQVHSGKLVLAPKGVPLPGFQQPFPFSFTTEMESGQFDASFDIPEDNYTLPDFKLEFLGMRGSVEFNLPLRDIDNNLTETFWVDQIRWKQLHMEKAHLTVTYDLNGIYGKFGGEAYGGYIDGGFDVYLDDNFSWDGWISGDNIETTEITQKMFPAYFLLEGRVNAGIVAAGDGSELYHADISFSNSTPGTFTIAALNDMLDYLPPPQKAGIGEQFARIGLETLRDFRYDTIEAKGRLYGREGEGTLSIRGPSGSRIFEVVAKDHRSGGD